MAEQTKSRNAGSIERHRTASAESLGALLSAGNGAPTALVVDDEPQVRRFMSAVLRRQGWSVREAGDATAALAMARAFPPDLLVTDFEMPLVSGVALAEQLRESDEDLPVLLVSGYPDAAGSMRNLHGRTAFTRKPFAAEELVSSVGSIVSRMPELPAEHPLH
jgi:DNA-binding response OmpR family regulator